MRKVLVPLTFVLLGTAAAVHADSADEQARLLGPLAKAGCLDEICVGQAVSTMPKGIRFDAPERRRDLYAELEKARKDGAALDVTNLTYRIEAAVKAARRTYVAPDDVIAEIARAGNRPDTGGQLSGESIDPSFLAILAKATAACEVMAWKLHYKSAPSALPTTIYVAWGLKNDAGDQELRVESIQRDFQTMQSKEQRADMRERFEKVIGLKVTGPGESVQSVPLAFEARGGVRILAPRTLEYPKYANQLRENALCRGRAPVN